MDNVLLEDNPHWVNDKVYEILTHREILPKAYALLETKEVLALIGARRVGKSSLAKLLMRELLKSVDAKNIFFINLEKPYFIPHKQDPQYLEDIYDSYLKLADPNLDEKIYFFIDEIQIFENWEVFIKSKYENSNIKFIITGSNASLLHSELSTLLTGRVIKLEIYSFNFREFLGYKGVDISSKLMRTKNRIEIKRYVDEYMKWGGYFSVMETDDESIKKVLLQNIVEDIIFKDIVPRHNIKNAQEIRDMFFYLVSNASNTLTYASLSKKIGLDAKTVKEYVNYFEDNFLIAGLSSYHTKLTAQIKSAKKIYMMDNGFLNLGIHRTQNRGIYLENLVYISLSQSSQDLTYINESYEIDFFDGKTLYQVSYDLSDEKTKKREFRAFEQYKNISKENVLVTYDLDKTIDDITVIRLDSFLLQ